LRARLTSFLLACLACLLACLSFLLCKQVKKLKKCFDAIDLDTTGEISVNEFIHFAAAKDTLFVRAFLSKVRVLDGGWW